ncbi:CidA/LrgA family protein [Nocardioides psychrotolerans]|uniref:CidA/LrgA family protein n=1 Tax=Nocardioides psychrotolerans TaxID=1005945 RepID=UPI003138255B
MITGLTWLLACQLVGEVLVRLLDVPVPGPVVGMLLLLVVLRARKVGDDAAVVRAGTALLRHLQLLFIPAGVGVVAYAGVIRDLLPLAVALVGSWLLGLAVVGWTTTLLERWLPGERAR